MKNVCLALLTLILTQVCKGQFSPLEQSFTTHYKLADSLRNIRDFKGALIQLDSSLMMLGEDSLELTYNMLERAQIYEETEVMDSVYHYYERTEQLARGIDNKEPLKAFLVLKGYLLIKDRKLQESNQLVREAIGMLSVDDFKGAFFLGHAYKTLAESYILRNLLDSAYDMVQKMQYYTKADSSGQLLPNTYRTVSWLYYRLGDYEKSLEVMRVPFDAQNMNLNNLGPSGSVMAGNIALNYMMLGDYERAEEYLIAVTEMHRRNNQTQAYGYYHNMLFLAACYKDMKEYEKALEAINEHLQSYRELNSNYRTPYYYNSLLSKGRALAGLNRWKEAQEIFDDIVTFQKQLEDNRAPLLRTYLEIGMANIIGEQYEKALNYLFQSLELQRSTDQLKGPNAIPIMGNLADAYFGMKSYDLAMIYMDSSLLMNQYFVPYDSNKVMRYRGTRWQIELLNSKLEFLRQMWSENPSEEIMQSALDVIHQTNVTIDLVRKAIRGDNSRLEIADDFYDHAVFFYIEKYKVTGDPYDLRMAFSFTENNKSFLLNEITGEAAVSDSEDYQALLAEKARLKSMVSIHSLKEGSSLLYQYFDELDSIQQEIDNQAQYNHFRQISTENLMELSTDPVLTMHTAKDYVYTFLIDNGSLSYIKISVDSTFQEEVVKMREGLSDPTEEMYQLSITNDMTDFLKHVSSKKLTIIPDGILNYIPFELLALDASGDSLLMDRFNVNYRNSIFQLLDQKSQDNVSKSYGLVSFAPDFSTDNFLASDDAVRSELSSIPGAFDEVTTISEMFKGKKFIKEAATESNFKNIAYKYGMIHLATHALVDDKDPKQSRMIFNIGSDTLNDGYLHVHEIAYMDLNAQMVTLSACNTGFGKIKKGEGVMSLSRAFAYAGVPATVVSLWPASDKSTPELMKYFYQNLKDGQSKSEALNNARKQYLATATGKARHPFYWGGFVLIGDDSPIKTGNSNLASLLAVLFLLTCVPLILIIKNRYLSID
ncbi:MAG: CHAT domain-containing tetratricopeptide repeat protein [Reichenbachiella sp.]|uniref:CHAT domain-containing protein n=1 Tax=Reichenbachiella sp. TaxID=2184521 RepID=UPI003265FDED